jgi:uncharacterized damage-inducible protein DinB
MECSTGVAMTGPASFDTLGAEAARERATLAGPTSSAKARNALTLADPRCRRRTHIARVIPRDACTHQLVRVDAMRCVTPNRCRCSRPASRAVDSLANRSGGPLPLAYAHVAIPDAEVPVAADPTFQHALDTYVSETNKVASVWLELSDGDLGFRPHERATSVGDILAHQLLSERRFFAEFLGAPEPPADQVLPKDLTVDAAIRRHVELARLRLGYLARREAHWWLEQVPFFDVSRQRVWVFWRRVLHTAHHRTQLTVYLRVMGRAVPSTYGPTADVRWQGADPTTTVEAAARR